MTRAGSQIYHMSGTPEFRRYRPRCGRRHEDREVSFITGADRRRSFQIGDAGEELFAAVANLQRRDQRQPLQTVIELLETGAVAAGLGSKDQAHLGALINEVLNE